MRDTKMKNVIRLALCLSLYCSLLPVWAEDWPTYQHDNHRSGVTEESLTLPLSPRWEVTTDLPRTAWAGPAKWDSFANTINLKSMRNFDPVFYTTVVGDRMFYGSSVDDAVHCLDVTSGKEQWAFFTEGPVRLPPTYHAGHLLFTSDDGYAYCVDAASATELWKVRCGGSDRKVPNNGKLISLWPGRTGVLVADGIAYFSASLFPWKTSYLCAADVKTGSLQGPGLFKREHTQMTLQGPMLASSEHLYVSQGRQTPLVFRRQDGDVVRSLGSSGFGGIFGLLTDDATFVHGQGQNHRALGSLRFFKDQKQGPLFTYPRATSMVIHGNAIYLYVDGQLQALQRDRYIQLQSEKTELEKKIKGLKDRLKKLKPDQAGNQADDLKQAIQDATAALARINQQVPSAYRWKVSSHCALSLILAGDTLYAGGKNQVVTYDIKTGQEQWTSSVTGQAYGLTVSNGCLIVSTDLGKITCFGQGSR